MENQKSVCADAVAACKAAAPRLAELGSWPSYFDGEGSLTSRVPGESGAAPGFDAGLACALDLIPRGKQHLAAVLHAAYTEAAVEQVRKEMADLSPDSETCWWLAACSLCDEGGIDAAAFEGQLEAFKALVADPDARVGAAKAEAAKMQTSKMFELRDGYPYGEEDGCIQAAYLAGYDWGVMYNAKYGLWFIGTFRTSLGLESFAFSSRTDEQGRTMSGPVHGSKQFVKVSDLNELAAAVAVVRQTLGG